MPPPHTCAPALSAPRAPELTTSPRAVLTAALPTLGTHIPAPVDAPGTPRAQDLAGHWTEWTVSGSLAGWERGCTCPPGDVASLISGASRAVLWGCEVPGTTPRALCADTQRSLEGLQERTLDGHHWASQRCEANSQSGDTFLRVLSRWHPAGAACLAEALTLRVFCFGGNTLQCPGLTPGC